MVENLTGASNQAPSSADHELKQLHPLYMEMSVLGFPESFRAGEFDQFIRQFTKPNREVDESFVLKGFLGKKQQNITESGNGLFQTDGQYSFALGYLRGREKKPLWLAITSIATDEDSSKYRTALFKNGVDTDYECQLPLIVQLQGPAHWCYDNRTKYYDSKRVLEKLRWEKAMVALWLDWAAKNEIPAIYLLPSDFNQYRPPDWNQALDDMRERLRMRYDVTAKRMGLRRDGRGFYKRSIDSKPKKF